MMFQFSRENDSQHCVLCETKFNSGHNYPESLMTCGHTFCRSCIQSRLKETKKCAICRESFNQAIPDYEMLDLIVGLRQVKVSNQVRRDSAMSDEVLFEVYQEQEVKAFNDELVTKLFSGSSEEQLECVRCVRKILSIEQNPPIQQVIDAGLVPKMAEFLHSKNPKLQFESLWVLTNIASGTRAQTQSVIDSGSIPSLIRLIDSKDDEIKEQAIWTLSNIAGDNYEHRDVLVEHGLIPALCKVLLNKKVKQSLVKNGIWCISNLCRDKHHRIRLEIIRPCLPILAKYLAESDDEEVLSEILWAISYLTDTTNENLEVYINSFDLKRIAQLLKHQSNKIVTPSLRITGNIVTGNDQQTQVVLDMGVLNIYGDLLHNPRKSTIKEACWAISNITAGNTAQIQAVIDANLFSKLFTICQNADFAIKKELAWIVANAISGGTANQMIAMIEQNVLQIISLLLDESDSKLIKQLTESIERIIQVFKENGSEDKEIIKILEDNQVMDKIKENCGFSEESMSILNMLGIELTEISQSIEKREDNQSKKINQLNIEFVEEDNEEEDEDEEDETSSQADDY